MTSQSKPKKSLGQHWLQDESVLDGIVSFANVTSVDHIVEVGPGLGFLTKKLSLAAKEVVAVEFDTELARQLPSNVQAENLQVIEADILDFDYSAQPKGYKLVGNIPYYLTSHLLRVALEQDNKPSVIVFLIQKEVAQRLAAKPGSMSILSVTAQFYADVSLGEIVPAELFTPPPKVDSQVVKLAVRKEPMFNVEVKHFFRLVKAGFGEKRKKLSNSLTGGLALEKTVVLEALNSAKIQPLARAQELSLADWYGLYVALNGKM